MVGGGCRKRDSASSKLKLKKQASLSLGPVSTFFFFPHPSFLRDCFVSTDVPSLFFWLFAVIVACHLKSFLPLVKEMLFYRFHVLAQLFLVFAYLHSLSRRIGDEKLQQ